MIQLTHSLRGNLPGPITEILLMQVLSPRQYLVRVGLNEKPSSVAGSGVELLGRLGVFLAVIRWRSRVGRALSLQQGAGTRAHVLRPPFLDDLALRDVAVSDGRDVKGLAGVVDRGAQCDGASLGSVARTAQDHVMDASPFASSLLRSETALVAPETLEDDLAHVV